ncbi:MAG: Na(+)/H(+) antiporter subunit B [Pseudomonadota bacterium]|nr:Na(+)/H(+) antiporter subunit B [Pseudomonadota bacterium]
MTEQLILRVIAKLLIPSILLFALYVQFHGDYGPGGGFQAGVIFASGFILYTLVFGLDKTQQVLPPRLLETLVALGVLLYAGVGIATMLLGENFLDYDVLAHDPKHGQHLGIILVELGVGITVAAVMIVIFSAFAGNE